MGLVAFGVAAAPFEEDGWPIDGDRFLGERESGEVFAEVVEGFEDRGVAAGDLAGLDEGGVVGVVGDHPVHVTGLNRVPVVVVDLAWAPH